MASLQAEAARLREEAQQLQASMAVEGRRERARRIAAGAARVGEEGLRRWLEDSCGLQGSEAQRGARSLSERLVGELRSGGVDPVDFSLEELASPAFEAALEAVLAERREGVRLAREAQEVQAKRQAEERRSEEEEERRPWRPDMLNDDRSTGTRALAVLPYIFPMFDRLQSALPLAKVLPALSPLFELLAVPFAIFGTMAFGTQIWWLVLTLTAASRRLPRLVRFNVQQAVLIDVAFFVATILGTVVYYASGGTGAAEDDIGGFLYSALLLLVGYSAACSAFGRDPDGIPFISDLTKSIIDAPPPPGFGSDE